MIIKGKTMRSVDVDWNEFYYTNCPLVSPSNVDQEIGWVKEEFKKIGIAYKFLRSTRENDWYPHYVHNLDNLMRYRRLLPGHPRPGRHPSHPAHRDDACVRRRLHAGARPGPDLPDEGSEGQEDRPLEEPEHHQE